VEAQQQQEPPPPKPMMGIGDTLRSMLCWSKLDLMGHEKCLKFMTNTCKDHTSGQGMCTDLRKMLWDTCQAKNPRSESACMYAKKLGIVKDPESEKKDEKEDKPEKPDEPKRHKKKEEEKEDKEEEKKEEKMEEVKKQKKPEQKHPEKKEAKKEDEKKEEKEKKDEEKEEKEKKEKKEKKEDKPKKDKDETTPIAAPAPAPSAAKAPPKQAPSGLSNSPTLPPNKKVIDDKEVGKGGLPEQGYSDHSKGMVEHEDAVTQTGDWGREFLSDEDKEKAKICEKYKSLEWCKGWLAAHPKHADHHPQRSAAIASALSTLPIVAALLALLSFFLA